MADKQYTWDQDFVENNPHEDTGLVRYGGRYTNDTRKALDERIDDEHEWDLTEPAPQIRMGFHKRGSAVSFVGNSAPDKLPDGTTNLGLQDAGRLWFDTATNTINGWNGFAWVNLSVIGTGTKLRWDATAQYFEDEVVEYQGELWISLVANPPIGVDPAYPVWGLYTLKLPDMLVWQPEAAYSANDLVFHAKSFWVAITPIIGTAPDDPSSGWEYYEIPTTGIADGAITEVKIADGSVSFIKLGSDTYKVTLWDSAASYILDDIVNYDGVWYKCDEASAPVGTPPTDASGPWERWTEKTSESISNTATIVTGMRDHIVFADTSSNTNYIVTLEDGDEIGDNITIASHGGGIIIIEGTGLDSEPQIDVAVGYIWSGVKWIILGAQASGISEVFPPFDLGPKGDELLVGELIGDGTDSLVSSSGREPVVGNVEFIPGRSNIDGVDYYDPQLKWPGKGVYGVFDDYENKYDKTTETLEGVTVTDGGGWIKITGDGTSNGRATYLIGPLTTSDNLLQLLQVMKGSSDTVYFGVHGSNGIEGTIDFTTKTVSMTAGTDINSYFISDNICLINVSAPVLADSAGGYLNLYSGSAKTANTEHTYYRNIFVSIIDFPVPYTKGTHNYNRWLYGMDWALSSQWTVEGWFYNTGDTSHSGYINIFHTAVGSIPNRWTVYFSPGERVLRLYTMLDSGGAGLVIGDPVVGWNHVKILWESGVKFRASLNGAAYVETTSSVLETQNCNKIVALGSFGDDTGFFNSYLADWKAQAGIEDSHDHYLSDKAWYVPTTTYGKDCLWSITRHGHMTGLYDNAGRIIEEYERDEQHVTKWDTGRMEIVGENIFNSDITNNSLGGYKTTETFTFFTEPFISKPNIIATSINSSSLSVSSTSNTNYSRVFLIYWAFAAQTAAADLISEWRAIGRWK